MNLSVKVRVYFLSFSNLSLQIDVFYKARHVFLRITSTFASNSRTSKTNNMTYTCKANTKVQKCSYRKYVTQLFEFMSTHTKDTTLSEYTLSPGSLSLKVAQNRFRPSTLILMGRYIHSLSLDATIMISKTAQSLVNALSSFS